jgi:hypothetical protein
MANGELIDAREAMEMLGIAETDLQNLVARGDLRAFRSAGTMKFRRDDVMALKQEKGTEPTIIIPAAGTRKPGQSGILTAVGAPQHAAPAPDTNATDQIILDDIELQQPAGGLETQQQTVVSAPVGAADARTIVEPGVGAAQTGEMTVVDSAPDQAQVGTGPAAPVRQRTGSGAGQKVGSRVGSAVGASPAVSRVRAPSVPVARRTATVYEPKTSHPLFTAAIIVNSAVMIFAACVLATLALAGTYNPNAADPRVVGTRIIPPYLRQMGIYESFIDGKFGRLPGRPADPLPQGSPDIVTTPVAP